MAAKGVQFADDVPATDAAVDPDKSKKRGKKKSKKADDLKAMFAASVSAQKDSAAHKKKTVDLDELLSSDVDAAFDDDSATHARTATTTQNILTHLPALEDDDDDDDAKQDTNATNDATDDDGKTTADNDADNDDDSNADEDNIFLHDLTVYLAKDFMKHKRSWSTISSVSGRTGDGGSISGAGHHGRSGTLFSLSHSRSRHESMQLILNTAKLETKTRGEESQLFTLISTDASEEKYKIDKLMKFLEHKIDLTLLFQFLDVILFKTIKYYRENEPQTALAQIYASVLDILSRNKQKCLRNACFRQYVKFLSASNREKDNPLSSVLDRLHAFEDKDTESFDFKKDRVIRFWQYVANKGFKDNVDEISVNTASNELDIYDPIRCDFDDKNSFLTKVVVRKEFNSAKKPLLLDVHCSDHERSSVIIKKGDDLRKDKALMNIFKFMNFVWLKESKLKGSNLTLKFKDSLVKILTFNVVPMTSKLGVIELVPNCIPLRHINKYLDEIIDEHKTNLMVSAAASYIASFVCGVKDRHFDNILLRSDDCTLFHIDFGYCLGESIKNPLAIDTSTFAITEDFYNIIGKDSYHKVFVPLCVDTFLCLRKYHEQLIEFTLLAFSYLTIKEKQAKKINDYLDKKLRVKEDNVEKVKEWLTNEIKKAPFSKKTKLKNKLHRMNAPTLTESELSSGQQEEQ